MRYSSVGCTVVVPVRPRRRLGFLVCSKCLLPARGRSTFPLAVILKRLAADFFVLMPFGRRINQSIFCRKRARNIVASGGGSKGNFDRGILGSAPLPCSKRTCCANQRIKVERAVFPGRSNLRPDTGLALPIQNCFGRLIRVAGS